MSTEHNDNSRVGLFYSKDSFNLDIEYSRHYVKTDLNMKFDLYRVNHTKTKKNNIYGETKASQKTFLPSIELYGMINLSANDNRNLNGNGIRREDVGEVTILIFKKELDENDVQLNSGDYIAYYPDGEKLRYFEITNPNFVDYSTGQTRGGLESIYKRITAIPVREDVILKFNE